jgi:hypothetical protein
MRVDQRPQAHDRGITAMSDLKCPSLKGEFTCEPRPRVMRWIAALGGQRVHQGPRRCQFHDELDTRTFPFLAGKLPPPLDV